MANRDGWIKMSVKFFLDYHKLGTAVIFSSTGKFKDGRIVTFLNRGETVRRMSKYKFRVVGRRGVKKTYDLKHSKGGDEC